MRIISSIFLLLLFVSSLKSENIPEDAKVIYQKIKDTLVDAVSVEGVDGGVRYRMDFDNSLVVYDKDMNQVYSSNQMKESIDFEYFLEDASNFAIDDVEIDKNTANVYVNIYNGTMMIYRSKMVLNKFDETWKIVSKIFYVVK